MANQLHHGFANSLKVKIKIPEQEQIGQKLESNFAHELGQAGSKYGQIPLHVDVAIAVVVIGPLLNDVVVIGPLLNGVVVVIGPLLNDLFVGGAIVVVVIGPLLNDVFVGGANFTGSFFDVTPADLIVFVDRFI